LIVVDVVSTGISVKLRANIPDFSQVQLDEIAWLLNNRQRMALGFINPEEGYPRKSRRRMCRR